MRFLLSHRFAAEILCDADWSFLFSACRLSPHSIRDSIWLSEGTLAIGVDSTLFLHSRQIDYGPRTDGQQLARARGRDLFESVALSNAPLEDWHPQLLLQCMLWSTSELTLVQTRFPRQKVLTISVWGCLASSFLAGSDKVDLVKKIVTQLYLSIESALNQGLDELQWTTFEAEAFFGTASGLETMRTNANGSGGKGRYQGLFGDVEDEAEYVLLTASERATLIQTDFVLSLAVVSSALHQRKRQRVRPTSRGSFAGTPHRIVPSPDYQA